MVLSYSSLMGADVFSEVMTARLPVSLKMQEALTVLEREVSAALQMDHERGRLSCQPKPSLPKYA